MNVKTFVILLGCFLCLLPRGGWALDWKALHEEAGRISLDPADQEIDPAGLSKEELYIRGLVYFKYHRDQKAQQIFAGLREKLSNEHAVLWGYAESLRRQHRYSESIPILEEIIDAHPDFAPAYISLGYIRYMQMEFNQTARLAAKVLALGRDDVDTTNFVNAHGLYAGAKGMIAHYGGPLSKAVNGAAVLPHLKAAQKIDPESISVLYGLGSFYLLAPPVLGRDIDKALRYLEQAREADPYFADIHVRIAQGYRAQGDMAKYEQAIEEALRLDPQNEIALDVQSRRCKFICLD